jgi:hypothetical protein
MGKEAVSVLDWYRKRGVAGKIVCSTVDSLVHLNLKIGHGLASRVHLSVRKSNTTLEVGEHRRIVPRDGSGERNKRHSFELEEGMASISSVKVDIPHHLGRRSV